MLDILSFLAWMILCSFVFGHRKILEILNNFLPPAQYPLKDSDFE